MTFQQPSEPVAITGTHYLTVTAAHLKSQRLTAGLPPHFVIIVYSFIFYLAFSEFLLGNGDSAQSKMAKLLIERCDSLCDEVGYSSISSTITLSWVN